MLVSVHRWPDVVRWIACVLLLVLSGCAALAPRFPPSMPPAASGVDPGLDAQTRLIESAYRAYVQGRYPLASALFQRFVDANPDSPRLSEARWWLARSYEQSGDLPAALSAYRAVVGAASRSTPLAGSYEFHALNRLDAFHRSLGPSSLLERRQIALWLTNADWLTISDVGLWIEQLADAGVTALIVEAGSLSRETMQPGPVGVYFQTSQVPVVEDLFTVIVPAAHAKGMAVLASLNLHEPGWMTVNPEWGIAMADRTDQVFQPVGHVDVLHPDYQRLVSAVAQDLLRTDIDGLVVGPGGPRDLPRNGARRRDGCSMGNLGFHSIVTFRLSHQTHGAGPGGRRGAILGLWHDSLSSCDRRDRDSWSPWSFMSVRSSFQ